MAKRASPRHCRAVLNKNKKHIIRGKQFQATYIFKNSMYESCLRNCCVIPGPNCGTEGEDFEGFIRFANRVRMDDEQYDTLKRLVQKHMPKKPLYICTIKKSNVLKHKAQMVRT